MDIITTIEKVHERDNMRLKILSEVYIDTIGKIKHEHIQEFEDDSNVFGRVYDYHQYMYRTFPGCNFKLIEAKEVK